MRHFMLTIGSIALLQGMLSLIEGVKFLRFVRRESAGEPENAGPRVTVIAPCKGPEPDLERNLSRIFQQDYHDYEVVLVVSGAEDPALPTIERVRGLHPESAARVVIAPPAKSRSRKVNNLLHAIENSDPASAVLVFVDSDALADRRWLASLVAPLVDRRVGAATGYRWYLPRKGGFLSALLSGWNGSIATSLGDHGGNFAWGGSTAITREAFESAGVGGDWRTALSDDYALTRAIKRAGLEIRFVPSCLLVSHEDPTLAGLLEFTNRQIVITRVYSPRLWWLGLLSHSTFSLAFFGSLVLAPGGPLYLLLAGSIYLPGCVKGALRMIGAVEMLPEYRREVLRLWWMYVFLWPLVSLLFLTNFLCSSLTNRITWRGVRYEMRSPTETIELD